MKMNEFLESLSKLAPGIGTIIGGPVGALVGGGISLAAKLITGKDQESDVLATLQANPELLAQVVNHAKDLEADVLKARLADVQSARNQTISLAQAGSKIAWGAPIVSCIIMLGFFFCLDLLFFKPVDVEGKTFDLLNQLFGALVVMATAVVQYWVGSTNSNNTQMQWIANSVPAHLLKDKI